MGTSGLGNGLDDEQLGPVWAALEETGKVANADKVDLPCSGRALSGSVDLLFWEQVSSRYQETENPASHPWRDHGDLGTGKWS
jgi:hypothetical protein